MHHKTYYAGELTSGEYRPTCLSYGQWRYFTITTSGASDASLLIELTSRVSHVYMRADATPTAQLFDVRLYHFWWRVTGGRHMWIRNNGSTGISQLVDTIIVNGIFLRWGLDLAWGEIVDIIIAVYLFKLVLAALDTPLIYLGRGWMERFLGIEHDPTRASAPLA